MGILQHSEAAQQWFSLIASEYDATVSPLFWPVSLQQEGLEYLNVEPDDRILDIGCGTGKTIKYVIERASVVHGLDQSRPQLETASKKEDLLGVEFVQGDAQQLPYSDEAFDSVISVGSILYWSKPADVLREAHRVTKADGRILIMGFNRRPPSVWNPVQNFQNTLNTFLFFQYSPREAFPLFRRAGWTNIENIITGPDWSPGLVIITTAKKPDYPNPD